MPLELVELAGVKALEVAVERLDGRVAALRDVAESLAAEDDERWWDLRRRAREALRIRAPANEADDVEIVEAWGCPTCGRVDAPQPCMEPAAVEQVL